MKTKKPIPEEYYQVNHKEFAVNINTKKDLKIAEKILKQNTQQKHQKPKHKNNTQKNYHLQ
ncbi:MAG: hypothetical protein QW279_02830 [Candidatus Jordarchaeaceae archaeon]